MQSDDTHEKLDSFYAELPQADYIGDLNDIPIQDIHFNDNDDNPHGLSDEQVLKLADDNLASTQDDSLENNSSEPNLFSNDS